jgi:hypothetical protein
MMRVVRCYLWSGGSPQSLKETTQTVLQERNAQSVMVKDIEKSKTSK